MKAVRASQALAIWLLGVATLVAVTVILGGITRLTGSGLSIVEWNLIGGILPPLTESDWMKAFDKYKEIPEFSEENSWMELKDFRSIFWWEWVHRIAGRLLGVAYAFPLLVFAMRGIIPRGWGGRLLILLGLGALQGAIGWWMVRSGLVDRVDVNPVRLAVHLGFAFLILGLLIDCALQLLGGSTAPAVHTHILRRLANLVLALVFLQVVSGGLVAGTGAGRIYTDWPLMTGLFLPETAFDLSPVWRNFIENPALLQFNHRLVAYAIVIAVVAFAFVGGKRSNIPVQAWTIGVLCAALVQSALGVTALYLAAPLSLALAHQFGAVLMFGIVVVARRVILASGE